MQISYLLYDGSAYPKLTPPVSSPYPTTFSLSFSLSLSLSLSRPSLLLHSALWHTVSLFFSFLPSVFFLYLRLYHPFLPNTLCVAALLFRATPRLSVSVARALVILTFPLHIPARASSTHPKVSSVRTLSPFTLILSRSPCRIPCPRHSHFFRPRYTSAPCRTFRECFFRFLRRASRGYLHPRASKGLFKGGERRRAEMGRIVSLARRVLCHETV